jgi:hypothetical protein
VGELAAARVGSHFRSQPKYLPSRYAARPLGSLRRSSFLAPPKYLRSELCSTKRSLRTKRQAATESLVDSRSARRTRRSCGHVDERGSRPARADRARGSDRGFRAQTHGLTLPVHRCPSHQRSPDAPVGSGYQPAAGYAARVRRRPRSCRHSGRSSRYRLIAQHTGKVTHRTASCAANGRKAADSAPRRVAPSTQGRPSNSSGTNCPPSPRSKTTSARLATHAHTTRPAYVAARAPRSHGFTRRGYSNPNPRWRATFHRLDPRVQWDVRASIWIRRLMLWIAVAQGCVLTRVSPCSGCVGDALVAQSGQ